MATIDSLVGRVRTELGDLGKSFVQQFMADGTTNRFKLNYSPLDGASVRVWKNDQEISDQCSVEESTGVLVIDTLPLDGDEFTVNGSYFRYFTTTELANLVTDAVAQHAGRDTDSTGRKITVSNLPFIEEYPVAIFATTMALYTLATDAAFDIDIMAPDGVNIPRSERYRQLMEMITTRQGQYRELCVQLGIGLYSIDVFSLRRVSKTTNRYVPVYKPQEVDDRSFPQRADLPLPTYGDQRPAFPTEAGELTAYQGRSFATSVDVTGNYAGKSFVANVVQQRGSLQLVQTFALSVTGGTNLVATAAIRNASSTTIALTVNNTSTPIVAGNVVAITGVDATVDGTYTVVTANATSITVTGTATTALNLGSITGAVEKSVESPYTFTMSLTAEKTRWLANRTWWQIQTIDAFTDEKLVIAEGNLFTVRVSEVMV